MQSLGLFDGTIDLMHLFKPGFGTASGLTPPLPPEEIACVDSRKIRRIELRSVASSPFASSMNPCEFVVCSFIDNNFRAD